MLCDSPLQKRVPVSRKRRFGVHAKNEKRRRFEEYHHLFPNLRRDEERFKEYTRMSIQTFDYILNRVKDRLTKKRLRLRQQVQAEERLFVTLR
jgi:hypothetical protein